MAVKYEGIVTKAQEIYHEIIRIAYKIIKIPFMWWRHLPETTKWVIQGVVIIIMLLVIWWAWRHRHDWKHLGF